MGDVNWVALLPLLTARADTPLITDGERVLFYGDSITASQKYSDILETMIRLRYPGAKLFFMNVGQGSDSSWGGPIGTAYQRVSRDVVPFHPTVISVMLGMNDGGYVSYNDRIKDNFQDAYSKLIEGMRAAHTGARFTFCLTSPYDAVTHSASVDRPNFAPDYNDALLKYGTVVRKHSDQFGAVYVDANTPLLDVLRAASKRDVLLARQIIPDCIHPTDAGHLVIAAEIAKGWGFGPASTVVIDGSTGALDQSTNTTVTDLTELTWKQTDAGFGFSMPRDRMIDLVTQVWPRITQVMGHRLQVRKVPPGTYVLTVGGKRMGTYTAAQLAEGISVPSPAPDISAQVLDLVRQRNALVRKEWLKRRLGDLISLSDELEGVGAEYLARVRDLVKTRTYVWELRRFVEISD